MGDREGFNLWNESEQLKIAARKQSRDLIGSDYNNEYSGNECITIVDRETKTSD